MARDGVGYGLDVLRRGAAAAPDYVQPAVLGPLPDLGGHHLGGLVVLAELVWQPGVRVGAYVGAGDAGELFDVLSKLLRPQGAVEADADRLGVAYGVPEGLRHLARERSPARVGDGARDHDRNIEVLLFEVLLDREDRRLRIQSIENRLDEQQVHAPVHKPFSRFFVRFFKLVESDVTEARVVHVRGDGGRTVGGTDSARHKAWLVRRLLRVAVRRLAGDTRCLV